MYKVLMALWLTVEQLIKFLFSAYGDALVFFLLLYALTNWVGIEPTAAAITGVLYCTVSGLLKVLAIKYSAEADFRMATISSRRLSNDQ